MNNPPKFDEERFKRQIEELNRRGAFGHDPDDDDDDDHPPPPTPRHEEHQKKAFVDELQKIAADITEQARARLAKKNPTAPAGSPVADKLKEAAVVKKALSAKTVGSYLQKQTNPQALAGASRSLMGRGAQMVSEGGNAAAKGQKYLLGANIAASRAGKVVTAGAVKQATPEPLELAGLGVLAVPGLDTLQAKIRSRKDPKNWEKKRLLGEGAHAAADVGGLGMLAADTLHKWRHP